jgi:hypothetical protein
MSFVVAAPETLVAASADVSGIGSALSSANAAAASATTTVAAAAGDEVSAAIASLFSGHAQEFQALSAQAAAFHEYFVNLLNRGAAQYVSTEMANAEETLVNTVNTPAQALRGQSLGTASSNAGASVSPTGVLSSLFPTTKVIETLSYGDNGTQTKVTNSVVLPNLGPLANEVTTYLPGSLGSSISSYISGLSGTPYITNTTISGSDASGNSINSESFNTLGGNGFGWNHDTANSDYSEFLSAPVLSESLTANAGIGVYGGSAYVAGTGLSLAANTPQGIYTLGGSLSVESLTAGGTVQVNTGTNDVSGTLSGSLPFNLISIELLANPGDDIYNYSQSGLVNAIVDGSTAPFSIPLN